MLTDFLLALPLFSFALFGAFHICELGYLISASGQASFFAARSEFVEKNATASAGQFSNASVEPVMEGRFLQDDQRMKVAIRETAVGSLANVDLLYPDLLPLSRFLLAPPTEDLLDPLPTYELPTLRGFTGIPRRIPK